MDMCSNQQIFNALVLMPWSVTQEVVGSNPANRMFLFPKIYFYDESSFKLIIELTQKALFVKLHNG
jgi:hypothetical protein